MHGFPRSLRGRGRTISKVRKTRQGGSAAEFAKFARVREITLLTSTRQSSRQSDNSTPATRRVCGGLREAGGHVGRCRGTIGENKGAGNNYGSSFNYGFTRKRFLLLFLRENQRTPKRVAMRVSRSRTLTYATTNLPPRVTTPLAGRGTSGTQRTRFGFVRVYPGPRWRRRSRSCI